MTKYLVTGRPGRFRHISHSTARTGVDQGSHVHEGLLTVTLEFVPEISIR